jgi:hypothetical protein
MTAGETFKEKREHEGGLSVARAMGLANEEIIPPKEGIKAAGGRYA